MCAWVSIWCRWYINFGFSDWVRIPPWPARPIFFWLFFAFFFLLGTSVWAPFGPQSGPHPPSAEPPLGHHGTWSHEKEASAKMVQYDFVWVATHLPNVHGSTISVRLIDPNLYHKLNSANVQLMYACRCEWKCEVVRSEIRDLRLFNSCSIHVQLMFNWCSMQLIDLN